MGRNMEKAWCLLCAAAALLVSCGRVKAEQAGAALPEVRVAEVERREIPDEVSGFGSLSFLKKVDIAAPQDAAVVRLPRREAAAVAPGDVLAVLSNPQIQLAVGRAENGLSQARAALELAGARLMEGEFQAEARILDLEKGAAELAQARRELAEQERKHADQEALFQAGGVTEEAVRSGRFSLESAAERIRLMEQDLAVRSVGLRPQDLLSAGYPLAEDEDLRRRAFIALATATLRAERSAAEARLEASRKELESAVTAEQELTVRSPASGTVGGRYVEVGERVKREDKLLTVIDSASLYAVFPVRETEALRLRPGMEARVSVDGTGGTYAGTVDLVSPTADAQSFTFSVRVLLPRSGASLKPGMFCRVTIPVGPPRIAHAVPESAFAEKTNDQGRLFVLAGGTLAERSVRLGGALENLREVVSGVAPGEVVVDRPDGSLREGDRVQIAR